jgi:predicted CopG family antitoxin
MKSVNVVFEDAEFEALLKMKGTRSWHDFILSLKEAK